MTYGEFESKYPEVLQNVNDATRRAWKARGRIPEGALQKLLQAVEALQKSVAKPVASVAKPDATAKSVAKPVASVAKAGHFQMLGGHRIPRLFVPKKPEGMGVTDWQLAGPSEALLAHMAATDGVKPETVVRKGAEPAYDIMSDGLARGFPGDSKLVRVDRTTHTIRRQIEAVEGSPEKATPKVKAAIKKWRSTGILPGATAA